MKKIVLKYGLVSGLILVLFLAVMLPLCMSGTIDFERTEVIGYSGMLLSFLLVFFGIRSYRDSAGGEITFGRAFRVGILITLMACAVYVVVWEVYYFAFDPEFDQKYSAFVIEKMRRGGASAAALAAEEAKMARFRELYANPLINAAITFMEVFPVGLIMTLASAAILRRKGPAGGAALASAS